MATHGQLKEEFEDTKGVIRIRISKKNKQHSGQKKKYKTRYLRYIRTFIAMFFVKYISSDGSKYSPQQQVNSEFQCNKRNDNKT